MAKKKGPVKKRYGSKKAEPVPNLFERLSSHKKFDVLGRKKLNGPQEKSRLRSAAHELVGGVQNGMMGRRTAQKGACASQSLTS